MSTSASLTPPLGSAPNLDTELAHYPTAGQPRLLSFKIAGLSEKIGGSVTSGRKLLGIKEVITVRSVAGGLQLAIL